MKDQKEYIERLSAVLFWDADISQLDMERQSAFFVQRVLEYGSWDDWKLLRSYYGLERIVSVCKGLRTLDPVCLSYNMYYLKKPKGGLSMLSYGTVEPDTLELLKALMREPLLCGLRLVGGTALALQYGHRKSIDLDFSE